VAFAHAQFANDVAALAPGHWQWNAWLTPKGRVIAVFALARRSQDSLWLVLPDHPAGAFAGALQRYVFRRKLKIDVPAGLAVGGRFAAPEAANGAALALSADGMEMDYGGEGGARALWVGPAQAIDGPPLQDAWRAADLRHGLPRLPEAQREQWTPQQLSLDRLHAYSVKKGCYPGQEIVARTHFLGKAKRALRLFDADGPVVAGTAVREDGHDVGEVVCTAQDAGSTLLLAVLPLEHAGTGLAADGLPLRPQPMQDGLQR